ncbi:insulinase family protein [bacterium]|nr:insulinase family protein [bacterium]
MLDGITEPVELTLDNGFRVITYPIDGWPVVATLVSYHAGSLHEPMGCAGIAHLMEHMMFRGTERYPGGAIDALTAKLGGVNNAMTTTDYAAYYFALPSENWKTPLEIEADRMVHCRIDREILEVERKIAIEERRMAADDPETMLDEALDGAVFGEHPYARPIMGFVDDIRALTADDLRSFYTNRYAPDNASLVVVGGIDVPELHAACNELFAGIKAVRSPADIVTAPPEGCTRRLRISANRSTPRVAVGFRTPEATHDDSGALELLATLLAAGRSSRLYDRLVRKDRLATEISCLRLLQREPGLLAVSAALHPGTSPSLVESAMLEVLDGIARRPVDDEELAKGRRLARVDLAMAHDTVLGMAGTTALWEAIDTWRSGQHFEEAVDRVSAEDVSCAAARYLDREVMTVVTLDPSAEGTT